MARPGGLRDGDDTLSTARGAALGGAARSHGAAGPGHGQSWGHIAQEKIDTIRSIITHSAPPGRDAIAGTIATLVAVSAPLFSSVTPEWRKTAKQHEFVFAALDSLLRDAVVMRYRDLPLVLWFDEGLVPRVERYSTATKKSTAAPRRRSAATGS